MDVIIVCTNTDFPEPVRPAINICGILAKSKYIGFPPISTPNANGSTSANLTSAKTYELTFEVTESGNYIIRFQNQGDMGGGFEEFLLLMCKISKAEDPNLGNGINDAPAAEATVTAIYNLSGVRTDKMSPGVNIVRMSDGTTRKVYVK